MALPSIGELWDNKYRVDRVLGEGGMGVVFEAYHLRLEQKVALKCLLPELADNPAVKARFEREARAAARLRTRHVVKILDVETHPSGVPYMVMELMRGRDLHAEQEARGQLPFPELCDWLTQVAGALSEAHGAGIVHRDLKPSNIFLAEEPGERVAKVLDFGIAKSNAIVPGITYSIEGGRGICGTPQYMSPEQVTDGEVDGQADVWALGVVAYEMLAGKPPFDAETFTALAVKVASADPTPLQKLRPDLPPGLCDAIMRTLQKDKAKRTQSMQSFAQLISPFGTRSDLMRWSSPALPSSPSSGTLPMTPSVRISGNASTMVAPVTLSEKGWVATPSPGGAGKTWIPIALVGAVALLGGAVWFAMRPIPQPSTSVGTAPIASLPAASTTAHASPSQEPSVGSPELVALPSAAHSALMATPPTTQTAGGMRGNRVPTVTATRTVTGPTPSAPKVPSGVPSLL